MERAVELAQNPEQLAQQREQQRNQVSASQLLDHTGLARATERCFRVWWQRWLEREGGPLEQSQQPWPERAEAPPLLTPITNSLHRTLPLWLGPLNSASRQALEHAGHQLVSVDSLEPWGGLAELFTKQEQGRRVVVELRSGDPKGHERERWRRVYPHLVWRPQEESGR